MKKKLLVGLATTALVLTGCASGDGGKEVASTEAGKIRTEELYEEMKQEILPGGMTVGEQILQRMLIEEALEHKYGKDVTEKEVDKEYEETAKTFGSVEEFEKILDEQGVDPSEIKKSARVSLLMRAAIEDRAEITDEDLKEQYEKEKPLAKVQHILVENETEAEVLIAELNDGADFDELVEEHSIDPGKKENTGVYEILEGQMAPEFEEASLALEEGSMTEEPVESSHGFHIIRRLELEDDGGYKENKEELKRSIVDSYLDDDTFMHELIVDLLKDVNVQIKDDDLKGALAAYLDEPEADEKDEESEEDDQAEDETDEESEESDEEE